MPIEDLNTLDISPYDYEGRNFQDDYFPLMLRLIEHNPIVLATPVYWYTMSATMKIFIDRLSDLMETRKNIGRKLRGKDMLIIASFNTSMPQGFEYPFSQTAKYMGMRFAGCSYIYWGADDQLKLNNLGQIVKARRALGLTDSPSLKSTADFLA